MKRKARWTCRARTFQGAISCSGRGPGESCLGSLILDVAGVSRVASKFRPGRACQGHRGSQRIEIDTHGRVNDAAGSNARRSVTVRLKKKSPLQGLVRGKVEQQAHARDATDRPIG